MIRPDDIQVFVSAATLGSLSAAARELQITPAVASVAIKRLESALGTSLLARTTRNLRLTPAGADYLEYAQKALDTLKAGTQAIVRGKKEIQGELSITMPSDLGRNVLLPWLHDFQKQHKNLILKLNISDQLSDLYRHSVDVAIRYGKPEDSSLIAFPLMPNNRRVVCAAPHYLKRHGIPLRPQDLEQHNCLCLTLKHRINNKWRFYQAGKEISVKVSGHLSTNDGDYVRRLALLGSGIAYKSALDVKTDLQEGRLVTLLPEYQTEEFPLYFTCAYRSSVSPAIAAMRDSLRIYLNE